MECERSNFDSQQEKRGHLLKKMYYQYTMASLIEFDFSFDLGIWNILVEGNSAVHVFSVPSRSGEVFEGFFTV